jgi:hypothetical protein
LGALAAYRWSSLGIYVGRRPGFAWLHREFILGLYNFTEDTYRAFVETSQPADKTPESVLVPRIPARCDEIETAVSSAAGVGVSSLHVIKRAIPNHPRLLAMLMMTQSRAATTKELADRFGLANQTSVRSATRRARVLLASDPAFARLHKRATTNLDRAA